MKKLKKILICLLLAVAMIPSAGIVSLKASASESAQVLFNKTTFSAEVDAILDEYVEYDYRMPGTEDERQAAAYIKDYLDKLCNENSNFIPKNDNHVKNGVQTFTFDSVFDLRYQTSQNIVYTTNFDGLDKKVILGCHYDAFALKVDQETNEVKYIETEGINGSAASVATLLAFAKNLKFMTLNYNVEIVFFGAGESNNAGSKVYSQGISKDEAKDILCMINFDEIAYGKELYFYSNEISTKAEEFVVEIIKNKGSKINKVDVVNLNKTIIYENDVLGFGYTHMGIQSDNVNFMKLGITTFNFFAGDYSDGLIAGKCEYLNDDNITFTENDNRTYIAATQTADYVFNNAYEVFKTVGHILTDFDFMNVMKAAAGDANWVYTIFANQNLVTYMTVFAFIALLVVAMYIYYKLSVRAYHSNVEVEFLSSVVKICEQIDETGQDPNVAKAVSQVIARDIKKDKTLKSKKKKKDS